VVGLSVLYVLTTSFAAIPSPPAEAAAPAGRVQEVKFDAPLYGRTRKVWVRTPAAAPDSANLLIVFDGTDFLEAMPLPKILDSLEASGSLAPTVAVLVDNGSGPTRAADLANRASFAEWLCDELVPWARARFHTTSDRRRTAALGESMGGLSAAFVAWKRPDTIGHAVSLSGAFWRNAEAKGSPPWEWLTAQVARSPVNGAHFVLDVGALETHGTLGGAGPSILDANRRLRDALKAKGFALDYFEAPGGVHAPESWTARLPAALLRVSPLRPRSAAAPH
jgi:enterochelin esterase family protein